MSGTSVRERRGVSGRSATAVAAVLVVLAAGVFWLANGRSSSASDETLTSPATEKFGVSLPSTRAGQPFTFGSIPLCLTSAGQATVDKVSVVDPQGGLRVDAFSARPLSGSMFGSAQSSLAATGFGGSDKVVWTCAGKPGGAELAVQLSKGQDVTARGSGLDVSWHTDRGSGVVHIPAFVVLCAGPDQDVPECRALR